MHVGAVSVVAGLLSDGLMQCPPPNDSVDEDNDFSSGQSAITHYNMPL